MKIVIVYATYSGSTDMATSHIESTLSERGHAVTRKLVQDTKFDEFSQYDLIILGSPTWGESEPHEYFIKFIQENEGKKLPGKPFAVIGLGDTSYFPFCGSVDHLEAFIKKIQGKLVTESLRIDGYFFTQEQANKTITNWLEKLLSAS